MMILTKKIFIFSKIIIFLSYLILVLSNICSVNICFFFLTKNSEFPIKQKRAWQAAQKSAACQAQYRLRYLSSGIMVA